jgi:hypothetical protein
MRYTNKIYLKSGRIITQESNSNLADEVVVIHDWDKGSIVLESSNITAIPRREVEIIDTKLNEVQND